MVVDLQQVSALQTACRSEEREVALRTEVENATLAAAGAPLPAASEPEEPAEAAPDPAAAGPAVRAWATAWADQRVDDYLASYADSFQPPDGQSREAWAADRRVRIERPRSVEVDVEAARVVELSGERVSVSFHQAYRSHTYSDRVRKTWLLVWQDGSWKIAEERVSE
jgi:hypothetical protein